MTAKTYTPEELDKRIESIRYVLDLPANVISLNAEVRKDCEARLAELEQLKKKHSPKSIHHENEISSSQPPIA